MQRKIQQSVQKGLRFLASNQRADGGFNGLVSADDYKFGKARINDTIFATALILVCLDATEFSKVIQAKATKYLLSHRSQNWSWNYWQRPSKSRPYPDDLDDTAYAICGILAHDKSLITAEARARIAKLLIHCETQPGGPYKTWLVGSGSSDNWDDVDIAVNANIGHMLSRLGVSSKKLEDYIDGQIHDKKLNSPYYIGMVPILYFLSHWYKGGSQAQLARLVLSQIKQKQNSLHYAMLISAAHRLNVADDPIITKRISTLLKQQSQGAWPAHALYYEPPADGKVQFAGSSELTTAFVLEALSLNIGNKPNNINITTANITKPPAVSFYGRYNQEIGKYYIAGTPQIINIATDFAKAFNMPTATPLVKNLNKGSVNGWLAYTLYDDFIDNDLDGQKLPLANLAMRKSVLYFKKAFNNPVYHAFVDRAFELMDSANMWEINNARDEKNLPNYFNLNKLAERSWGQIISPTALLVAKGYTIDSVEAKHLHGFMRHYVIAKQLSDDCHDWQNDLARGHMSAVVTMLLKSCPQNDNLTRQQYFWQNTIIQVNRLIRHHIKLSKKHLNACQPVRNQEPLIKWLTAIENSCQKTEESRQAASIFIKEFSQEVC